MYDPSSSVDSPSNTNSTTTLTKVPPALSDRTVSSRHCGSTRDTVSPGSPDRPPRPPSSPRPGTVVTTSPEASQVPELERNDLVYGYSRFKTKETMYLPTTQDLRPPTVVQEHGKRHNQLIVEFSAHWVGPKSPGHPETVLPQIYTFPPSNPRSLGNTVTRTVEGLRSRGTSRSRPRTAGTLSPNV